MLAGLAGGLGEEQGTAVALSAVALGMLELLRRLHAQTGRTAWDAISIALEGGMAVRIEGNGRDAATESARLIRIPGRDSRHQQ